jgi:D-alanyl-D-alanine dipeptidase
MKQVVGLAIVMLNMSILRVDASAMQHCRQCVVVTTDSWSAITGTMSIFERESVLDEWRQHNSKIPVVVGKAGMGWGEGFHETWISGATMKREGDNKAPAGIFILRGVFGYAPQAMTKMSYVQVTPDTVCVDDPQSRRYNQLIDARKIDNRDWRSAEQMRRNDDLYKWGVIVDHNVGDHNAGPKPGVGSCIFLHIWRGPNTTTVGCTAMAERNIVDLVRWLDPTRGPLLVQLPRNVYNNMRDEWNLPPLR